MVIYYNSIGFIILKKITEYACIYLLKNLKKMQLNYFTKLIIIIFKNCLSSVTFIASVTICFSLNISYTNHIIHLPCCNQLYDNECTTHFWHIINVPIIRMILHVHHRRQQLVDMGSILQLLKFKYFLWSHRFLDGYDTTVK